MTTTTFVDKTTPIVAAWLNDVDIATYYNIPDTAINASKYLGTAASGIDPTGATSSVAGLNALAVWATSGYVIRLRGTFLIDGQVNWTNKNLIIDTRGARFVLTGDLAGFAVNGTVSDFTVLGGYFTGDGINRDPFGATKAQTAWIFGDAAGSNVQNVKVYGGYCTLTNVGWKFSAAAGVGGTKTKNCTIIGATAYDIRGYDGGCGYGIVGSQADGLSIIGCIADTCQRHGIYVAEGLKYTLAGNKTFRCGKNDGTLRGSLCISRSSGVSVAGHVARGNYDVGLNIDTDVISTYGSDNVLDGVDVDGYVAYDNAYGDVVIGTTNPSVDGYPKNVTVRGRSRPSAGFSAATGVDVRCGERIKIEMDIDGSAAAASYRAVTLSARGTAPATLSAAYTKDIEIYGSIDSAGYGIQVASVIQTGTNRITLKPTRCVAATNEFEFLGGEDATTNVNLVYRRINGRSGRTYTSSGTNITIPLGGITDLTISETGVTSIANFSGEKEGDLINLYFTGGAATMKNTNFHLAGGVDFTPTANTHMVMQYRSGAWREVSRSTDHA